MMRCFCLPAARRPLRPPRPPWPLELDLGWVAPWNQAVEQASYLTVLTQRDGPGRDLVDLVDLLALLALMDLMDRSRLLSRCRLRHSAACSLC